MDYGIARLTANEYLDSWRMRFGSPVLPRLAMTVNLGVLAFLVAVEPNSRWVASVVFLAGLGAAVVWFSVLFRRAPGEALLWLNPLAWSRDWRKAAASLLLIVWLAHIPLRPFRLWEWPLAAVQLAVAVVLVAAW